MISQTAVIPFSQIIGQDRAVHLLKEAIRREKMPHAYLFAGVPGVGKTTTALAVAQALNCEHRGRRRVRPVQVLSEVVGRQLSGCRAPRTGRPEHQDRTSEGPRTSLGYKPIAGRYRVTIVRPAGAMTEEASNAFLKTLEEPPAGNILVLNATEPLDLLATIVSRCQKVGFRRIPRQLIEEWLIGTKGMDRDKASVLARISDGSPGRALDMEESGFLEKRQEYLFSLNQLQSFAAEDAVEWASRFVKKFGKEDRRNRWEPSWVCGSRGTGI